MVRKQIWSCLSALMACSAALGQTQEPVAGQAPAASPAAGFESSVASAFPAFEARRGERLSGRLREWLAQQSVELTWDASASTPGRVRDIEFLEDFYVEGASLRTVLAQVLPPYGFDADVIDTAGRRRVVVRNARNSF